MRAAVIQDCEAIYNVHVESIKGVCGKQGGYSQEQIQMWVDRQSVDRYVDPITRGRVLVAYRRNQEVGGGFEDPIVGFGHYEFNDDITMEIKALYVSPDTVGVGIGNMFMEKFLSLANESGRGLMKIVVASTNNAIQFYEKYGFVSAGECVHCERGCVTLNCTKMTRLSS